MKVKQKSLTKSSILPCSYFQGEKRCARRLKNKYGVKGHGKHWCNNGPGGGWSPIHAIHILALIKSRESFEDGIIDDPFVREDEFEEKYLDRYFITDSIQNALTS